MGLPARTATRSFAAAVGASSGLVVQPRMGFADPARMRAGLLATRDADANTVGTITVDSYTRVGDLASAARAVVEGSDLNGYPIASIDPAITLSIVEEARFPVQVRHGSARPQPIVDALIALGIDATEGGPVSYCLPYGRVPLRDAVDCWARACDGFAASTPHAHLESFGGCLLGQLCPPSLLIAVSVLEGMFFRQHGIGSVSLSLTQQTNAAQDLEALQALRVLAGELLSDVDWHVVLYAYMGVFPRTPHGARSLSRDAALLAVRGGARRLIVKTEAEAHRIPTIAENVAALEAADAVARSTTGLSPAPDTGILAQARTLIDTVRDLHDDVGKALLAAFARGLLDVPFCLHADNAGKARSYVDAAGRLRWSSVGAMPIHDSGTDGRGMSSTDLLAALSFVQRRYDKAEADRERDLESGTGVAALSPSRVPQ